MALDYRMIEPFVERQVRAGVISYGVSSYGYDLRVSREYKIFQPQIRAKRLTEIQAGYVAGVIDGMGEVAGSVERPVLRIRAGDGDLLGRLASILGTGRIEAGMLEVERIEDTQFILGQVLPYLAERRRDAARVVEREPPTPIVVDPKKFDLDSFVDFEGDACIIPANSFALARTVEYLRIPRQVMTVCLGKSSYARCGIIVNVTPLEPEWEGHATLEISNTTPLPAKIYSNEGICQLLFFEADEVCETSYADKRGKYQGQVEVTLPKV
jgi:deoxycytidine triphosphate deaminase